MDDIFVYVVTLPEGVSEGVLKCADGYTVYISDRLDQEHRIRAYNHAMWHIKNDDWNKSNVQEIEAEAHRRRPL